MSMHRFAGAMAVPKGRILAVGTAEAVGDAHYGAGTEVVDLNGATLLPGFIDPHTNPDEIVAEMVRFFEGKPRGTGPLFMGYGYDENLMPGGQPLTRFDLDKAFPDSPDLENTLAEYPADEWMKYDSHLKIGGCKITEDGPPQGKTAFFTTPYQTGGPGGEAIDMGLNPTNHTATQLANPSVTYCVETGGVYEPAKATRARLASVFCPMAPRSMRGNISGHQNPEAPKIPHLGRSKNDKL